MEDGIQKTKERYRRLNFELRISVFVSVFSILLLVFVQDVLAQEPDFIGGVTPPPAWQRFLDVSSVPGGPIVLFINMIFRLILIGAGIFSVVKVIDAGFTFMNSAGDQQKLMEGRDKLMMTLIGLLVIAGSFVLVAIVGIIFFGDWSMFFAPKITGAPPITPGP